MKILAKKTEFNFMGKRRMAYIFSAALIILSVSFFVVRGLNYGIDFTGGTIVELGITEFSPGQNSVMPRSSILELHPM